VVLGALWARLVGRRNDAAVKRAAEEKQMSPAERDFIDGRFEDRQADVETEAHLGGIDPKRLLGD
jgi:hypothetical protein